MRDSENDGDDSNAGENNFKYPDGMPGNLILAISPTRFILQICIFGSASEFPGAVCKQGFACFQRIAKTDPKSEQKKDQQTGNVSKKGALLYPQCGNGRNPWCYRAENNDRT